MHVRFYLIHSKNDYVAILNDIDDDFLESFSSIMSRTMLFINAYNSDSEKYATKIKNILLGTKL